MPDLFDRLKTALADRYAVQEEIGAGGMATVYLAEDLKLHRKVALKVLRPELTAALGPERFLREIEIAAKLHHPHILALHDSGEADGFLYYVMPYVEGESLRDLITREHQLPVDQAVQIAREVADALASAHKRDVVHRDIKPENILLQEEHAVVADFGLARAISAAGGEQLTETGLAVGTPAYMSPEQASADELDGRSDIYALGCVLYEMLAGVPPFTASTPQAVMARHAIDPVPSLSTVRGTVPPVVEAAITKALAKVPADRFATAGEFAEALTRTDAVTPTTATPVVARVPAEPSIAVLPFTNMSPDPENEYFSDGMSEEIINALTQLKGLRVAARTSSFSFKGKSVDIADVGARLKVETVLEGSVRKAGNKLRITAQLISVADGYHVWSERYDREMDDVFAIQDEIATAIAERLKVALVGETGRPLVKPPTENLQAYQLYLKGRYLWNKRTKNGLEQAVEYLRQAIERDPAYALAYAGLADAYLLLGSYAYMPGVEALSRAKASAERALELDETLAEAHTSRGQVLRAGRDRRGEKEEYRRAIELNPSYATAHQWYATLLAALGRSEEALREIRRAEELDPLSHAVSVTVAVVLFLGREYDAAMEQLGKTLELEPDFYSVHRMFGVLYVEAGLYEEAIGAVQRAIELNPEDPDLLVDLGCAYARSGQREKASVILEQAMQRGADAGWIAALYTALGDLDRAFEWLERGFQESESRQSLFYLKVFPWYDPLGSDPRFENLLLRMNLLE